MKIRNLFKRPMGFVTQNVCALPQMSQDRVIHDVRHACSKGSVVGWQEFYLDRYQAALRELNPRRWESFIPKGLGDDCPISWRKKFWERVDAGVDDLHQGAAGICRPRSIVWVKLRHRRSGAVVVFTNCHFVSAAWSGKKTQQELRQRMWRTGQTRMRQFVAEQVTRGYPVVGFGDYNSQNRRQLAIGTTVAGERVHYAVYPSSIDQVWFVGGEHWKWDIVERNMMSTAPYSDHRTRWARARLLPRKRHCG